MASVGREADDSRLEIGPGSLDRAISDLARRQHGVIAADQLAALGVAQRAVSHRLAAGRLHRLHRGVYAVGHPILTRHGRWMAAVLAGGPGAVLSHASAAALWEVRYSASEYIDVSVRRSGRAKRPGLRVHRPRTLTPDETTTKRGIPVTTPARTILDMATRLTPSRLEHLLDQAEVQELSDYPSLAAIARAHPGHRGARPLLEALNRHDAGSNPTRSGLEISFKDLCRRHGLPEPRINQHILGKEVDFFFEAHALVVETDSWRFHKTRAAFEDDRARDALLATSGYRTLRFTDRQIAQDAGTVAATVAALLAAATPTAPRSAPPGSSTSAPGPSPSAPAHTARRG